MSTHEVRRFEGARPRMFALRDPRSALLASLLRRISVGRLDVETPDGERLTFGTNGAGPQGMVRLNDWRTLTQLILGGALGFAEAYVDGHWSSPDLVSLLRLAERNREHLVRTATGRSIARVINRLRHRIRRNSRAGSRRNIAAHYDLGNAFYRLWLDGGMTYSSGLYRGGASTLEEAQEEKNRRIIEMLHLTGGENILEIGCGWGGLAERLARECAGRVTAITLSREQCSFAAGRIAAAKLDGRASVALADYRDIGGSYDRIASIEMIEAVGEANWPTYFATLRDRLVAGGVAVVQAITIADARFAAYRRGADFIQRHIFPGGMLPSPTVLHEQIERAGLLLTAVENFGADYARTIAEWRRRFHGTWSEIAALGFSPRFKRMWDYYLAYCEAGFHEGAIDVGLYRIEKPQ